MGYSGYKGLNHTEVWRAQVGDRKQASLVHEANGSRYSNIPGDTTMHYYWIRHVNSVGQAAAITFWLVRQDRERSITLSDLMLEHPEISDNPFTVTNLGTEESPNWVMAQTVPWPSAAMSVSAS